MDPNEEPQRHVTIGEIFYSLQTAVKFLPWVNKIYIVVDSQIPPIPEEAKDRVVLVDVEEIVPSVYLPVFFSDVIESFLHNIPGLSEIFIYNNDDMFFFDHVYKSDIYEIIKGEVKLKVINNLNLESLYSKTTEYSKRVLRTAKELHQMGFPQIINHHLSKFLRKSTLKFMEKEYKDLLDELCSFRFRNTTSIQYLFFALNVDHWKHNNIIIKDWKKIGKEYYFRNKNADEFEFHYEKIKFVCLNDMNETFIQPLQDTMNQVLI